MRVEGEAPDTGVVFAWVFAEIRGIFIAENFLIIIWLVFGCNNNILTSALSDYFAKKKEKR